MKKKMMSFVLCAALAATVLTGCGGEAASTGGSTASTSGSTPASAATPAAGEEDNIIKIGAVCAMTGGSAIYGEGA